MQSLLPLEIAFKASDAYPFRHETFIGKMEEKRD